jgi:hypothetical protein
MEWFIFVEGAAFWIALLLVYFILRKISVRMRSPVNAWLYLALLCMFGAGLSHYWYGPYHLPEWITGSAFMCAVLALSEERRMDSEAEEAGKRWALDYVTGHPGYASMSFQDVVRTVFEAYQRAGEAKRHRERRKSFHLGVYQGIHEASRVAFDAATKEKLWHHLEEIRRTVNKLELSDAEKDRLYNCIDDLGVEIGKDQTKVESYGALAMEAATYTDNASKPLSEAVWSFGANFGLARASAREQQSLTAPDKRKQLEAPKAKA